MRTGVPPPAQVEINLQTVRRIFHIVDEFSVQNMGDRAILEGVAREITCYELRTLRWLVRHTLHPESEDDIMPDEVEREELHPTDEGYTLLEVFLLRVPPMLDEFVLLQYRHQFWHSLEFDEKERRILLRPLGSYRAPKQAKG